MSTESEALARAAQRASLRPAWFGHAISRHCARHGLTDELLADWLGVSLEAVTRLRLCGLPVTDEHYLEIAEKFGVSIAALKEIMS